MPEEFEGRDLIDAVFWGVDLTGAMFRDVNLTGVRISHARVSDVQIDGVIERVVVNGVDVTDFVNHHDSWYPLRAMLRPADAPGLRAAWQALEAAWATAIERAAALADAQRHASVGGEWSFVETLRHLLFAMDKWFTLPILGETSMHPYGMSNTGSRDLDWPGVDRCAAPTFDEVLVARAQRSAVLRAHLEDLDAATLTRTVEILENGEVTAEECYYVVFEEEFEHLRYATRDLATFD